MGREKKMGPGRRRGERKEGESPVVGGPPVVDGEREQGALPLAGGETERKDK